ncbi:hypothetical protein GP486_001916 [Trichoglossum hirsutum]|uniref:Uncharacterized protein n=1 Tax=Trichoglossum hirsutum TaxID=265104 RepID=A0A9P8LFX5_9PEZI|nr:hypothetical protein GP486_001916 [Trichoglossum hirsutum]
MQPTNEFLVLGDDTQNFMSITLGDTGYAGTIGGNENLEYSQHGDAFPEIDGCEIGKLDFNIPYECVAVADMDEIMEMIDKVCKERVTWTE